VFGGDNYSEEWHTEAEQRGLLNLRATPDALPYLVADDTTTLFSNYGVLSERELESRYEVFLEQYCTKINIEAETAASIARTMLLPAAARHVAMLRSADLTSLAVEASELVGEFDAAIRELESANLKENQPDEEPLPWARYIHDTVMPAMARVREVADRLEKVVADDLWPLPKYSEILFIK
jgi:glutamine synthetase